eukprot:gene4075-2924_t
MEDALEFMQSRPLIGFQMDGSHLSNVLQTMIRQQHQILQVQRQSSERFVQLEEDISEIRDHQQELERLVADMGGADSGIIARVKDIEVAMSKTHREIEETRRLATAAADDADAAGRLADQANRQLAPVHESFRKLGQEVDYSNKQMTQDLQEITRALNELGKTRMEDEKRLNDALREVHQRAEKLARENGVDQVRRMVEELSDRTDENFKSVEESARAVDEELTRQNQLLQTLSAETDEKHQLLIDALREYERSSNELEEHLVMAGQALARRQATKRSPIRGATTAGVPVGGIEEKIIVLQESCWGESIGDELTVVRRRTLLYFFIFLSTLTDLLSHLAFSCLI